MKDEMEQHGAVDKHLSELQICSTYAAKLAWL